MFVDLKNISKSNHDSVFQLSEYSSGDSPCSSSSSLHSNSKKSNIPTLSPSKAPSTVSQVEGNGIISSSTKWKYFQSRPRSEISESSLNSNSSQTQSPDSVHVNSSTSDRSTPHIRTFMDLFGHTSSSSRARSNHRSHQNSIELRTSPTMSPISVKSNNHTRVTSLPASLISNVNRNEISNGSEQKTVDVKRLLETLNIFGDDQEIVLYLSRLIR